MAFQVSPGVQVKEIDLSNVVPAVSSTVGAFAGVFQWGPVDKVPVLPAKPMTSPEITRSPWLTANDSLCLYTDTKFCSCFIIIS